MRDIGELVPSLSVNSALTNTITYLRGVGNSSWFPGLETPVAIYVDGVYIASAETTLFDLPNIDRIEVLKGPQGTLFGRNATAGVIQLFTHEPTQDFTAYGHIGYGNYQTVKIDGYVSGGLANNLAADLSVVASRSGDGWGRNIDTGQDVNRNDHDDSIRSKWIFTPGTDTTITVIGDFRNQKGSFAEPRIPNGSVSSTGVPDRGGPWDTDAAYTGDIGEDRNYGGSLALNQNLGFAMLMDTVAYRNSKSLFDLLVNWSPEPGIIAAVGAVERQFSEELQLSSPSSSALKWTTGFYYFNSYGAFDPQGVVIPDTLTISQYFSEHDHAIAGYGQATYEFLPATNITLGARYTHEQQSVEGVAYGALPDGTAIGVIENDPRKEVSFDKPTFRIALDHRFSPQVLAYASFNTGFKSGGFNIGAPADKAYSPETLDAFEIGLKTDLLENRLRLNVDSFYYNYKDIQVEKSVNLSIGILNAAKARDYGFEADFDAVITDSFHLTGSAGYTNAKYTDFPGAPFSTPIGGVPLVNGNATGNYLPDAPLFQSTLTGDYRFDLTGGSTIHLTGSWVYNTGYYLQPDNVLHQPSYSKLNASGYWESASKGLNVRLWANNVTNEAVIAYGNAVATDGVHYATYQPPRTYGLTVGFKY